MPAYAWTRVRVCVSVGEGGREGRDRDRQTDRQTDSVCVHVCVRERARVCLYFEENRVPSGQSRREATALNLRGKVSPACPRRVASLRLKSSVMQRLAHLCVCVCVCARARACYERTQQTYESWARQKQKKRYHTTVASLISSRRISPCRSDIPVLPAIATSPPASPPCW